MNSDSGLPFWRPVLHQEDIELIQEMERLLDALFCRGCGIAAFLNVSARMKREGGVKSPGNPNSPVP